MEPNFTYNLNTPYEDADDYLFLLAMLVCFVPLTTCFYYYVSEYFDREPTKSLIYLKITNMVILGIHVLSIVFTSLPKINLFVGIINYAIYLALNLKRQEPKYYIQSSVFNFKALFPSNKETQIYTFNTGIVILHYILWAPYLYRFSFVLLIFSLVFLYPILDLFYQIRSSKTLPMFSKHFSVRFKNE